MRTSKDIQFHPVFGVAATIPKGTRVTPATNMPRDSHIKYWAEPWEGMSPQAQSWQRTMGFGLTRVDLLPAEES